MNRYLDVTAHELIARLAVEMANEVYEETMSRSNALYKASFSREDFIQQCAPTLKTAAKAILGSMLNDPRVAHYEKEKIFEALCLDHMLPKGGVSIAPKDRH